MFNVNLGEMGNSLQERINVTCIGESSSNVIFLPINISDLVGDVSAHDVILFNFIKGQVGIVDANQDDARLVGPVDQHLVVQLGHGNLTDRPVDDQINVFVLSEGSFEANDTVCSGVDVQGDVAVSCKASRPVFDRFPASDMLLTCAMVNISYASKKLQSFLGKICKCHFRWKPWKPILFSLKNRLFPTHQFKALNLCHCKLV